MQLSEAPSLDPSRKQRLHAHPFVARKWQQLARLERREARKQEAAQEAQEAAKEAREAAEQEAAKEAQEAAEELEVEKQKAAEKAQEADRRERRMIVGTVVGLLMAIVATLGVTTWWVRVRRVANLHQVTGRSSNLAPTEEQIG